MCTLVTLYTPILGLFYDILPRFGVGKKIKDFVNISHSDPTLMAEAKNLGIFLANLFPFAFLVGHPIRVVTT